MSHDSLGDRMKGYEDLCRIKLMKRAPTIIRIDGKAFHTYLAGAKKPFDPSVTSSMIFAARQVMKEIGGTARFAYTQSDECSIVLNNALDLTTTPWFDNNLQKMVSVAASVFTQAFNDDYFVSSRTHRAHFDARAFVLPELEEMCNYMIWRQQDATRNSIRMYAATLFSHNELHSVSNAAQDMMFKKTGFNWNDAQTWTKRGTIVTRKGIDTEIPIFTADRDYLKNMYLPEIENACTT